MGIPVELLLRLVGRPILEPEVLHEIASRHADFPSSRDIATNPRVSPETLQMIAERADSQQDLVSVAENPQASTETLAYLIGRFDEFRRADTLLAAILENPNTDPQFLEEQMHSHVLDRAGAPFGKRYGEPLGINPSTPVGLLRLLLSSTGHAAQFSPMKNPSLPLTDLLVGYGRLEQDRRETTESTRFYTYAAMLKRDDIPEYIREELISSMSGTEDSYSYPYLTPEQLTDEWYMTDLFGKASILAQPQAPMYLLVESLRLLADAPDPEVDPYEFDFYERVQLAAYDAPQVPALTKLEAFREEVMRAEHLLEGRYFSARDKVAGICASADVTDEIITEMIEWVTGSRAHVQPVVEELAFLPGLDVDRLRHLADLSLPASTLLMFHKDISMEERLDIFQMLQGDSHDFECFILNLHRDDFERYMERHHPALVGMPDEWVTSVIVPMVSDGGNG